MKVTLQRKFIPLILFLSIISCDSYFSYSPYEAALDRQFHNTTEKQLGLIKALDTNESKPFKVALLSDTHYHFDQLSKAVEHINNKPDIAFAIVTGDITEQGLIKEYIFFYDIMKTLNVPYVTVIGNHDYLSNGETIYTQMFGDYNYTFNFNNVKFVLFDNVRWESEKEPDFTWFAGALKNERGWDHVIPASHIPPFDQQLTNQEELYTQLMTANHITTSLHGHEHDFSLGQPYGDGVTYVTISSPQKRTYAEMTITPDSITVEKIDF